MLFGFILPVLVGNVLGGTALFAVLSYAQVMNEISDGGGLRSGAPRSISARPPTIPKRRRLHPEEPKVDQKPRRLPRPQAG